MQKKRKKIILVVAVCVMVVAGLVTLQLSRADTPFVTADPEHGTVTAPATTEQDAIRFRSPGPVATITIASWNTFSPGNPEDIATQLDSEVFKTADIAGLQELSDANAVEAVTSRLLCHDCAYDSTLTGYTYQNSSPNKVLLIWKKSRFTKLEFGIVNASPRTTINDGGDRLVIPSKFVAWAKLRDSTTGKQFYILNTHLINAVESSGRPIASNPDRLALYDTHMDNLLEHLAAIKQDNIPIFISGDFNVNYRYDHVVRDAAFPYVRMGSAGARSSFDSLGLAGIGASQGTVTSSSRLIDYFFHIARSDVFVKSHSISASSYGSDHYVYYNTVEIN